MSRAAKRPKIEQPTSKHGLISGQFMKSSFDNDSEPIDVPCPSPIPNATEPLISHPLPIVSDSTERRTVSNGLPSNIHSLLRVINTTYRSNLTSPKWKNFSGSRIKCQEKIRLNNAIWRIWHQQYIKNMKIVACRFVSLNNVQTLPTQLTQQAKQQILQNLTGEYLKWRQNSKLTLRKSLANATRTSASPLVVRRNATPPPDPFSFFDGLDLLEHQLLFSTTNSLIDREFENPFSVQGNNPDLYQPIMGNCHFDFNPLDGGLYPPLSTDDFAVRLNVDPVSTLSLPPAPPVVTATPTPINILSSNIYPPLNYSSEPFPPNGNYPSEPALSFAPPTLPKTNSPTLAKLLKSTKRDSSVVAFPPVPKTSKSRRKTKRQRSSISDEMPSSIVTVKTNEPIDTSPSSTSSCGPNADSKRRQNIKNGFESLRTLIPELNDPSNAKISKAHMLEFTARHIEDAIEERDRMRADLNRLELERNQLQDKVNQCQTRLPNDGLPSVPTARQSREASNALFRRYVAERTRKNWRFYPYSLLLRNVFDQFQNTIKCESVDEFFRSVKEWQTKALNLVHLRQAALQTVLEIGANTSFVQTPERVPDECRQLATSETSVHTN